MNRGDHSRAAIRRGVVWTAALAIGLLHALVAAGVGRVPLASPLAASLVDIGLVSLVLLALAVLADREAATLAGLLRDKERDRRDAVARAERLDAQNAVLRAVAEAAEVSLALVPMSRHIRHLVSCDQVGLALPQPDGQTLGTFSARVDAEERRARPRLELAFQARSSLIGTAVADGVPRLVSDLVEFSRDLLDANFWVSSGFRAAAIVPLVTRGRAVGALFVAARRPGAFGPADLATLQPLADVLAVAYAAQQLQVALARQQTAATMAEEVLTSAAEMTSALQTIVGHCDVIERAYPDPALQRDLALVVRQVQRIDELIGRVRRHTETRLRDAVRSADSAVDVRPAADAG